MAKLASADIWVTPRFINVLFFLIDDVTRRHMVNLWGASENERENRGFLQVIIIIRNCPSCTTKVSKS